MEELKGKVVLIDFWTYSCINCIRTTPYLNDWYEKYNALGFEIIGVHAPEFQFGLMCLRGLRILVIAAELVNQRLEAELGELRGANVIISSLAIALKNLHDINPDIVLIDFSSDDDFGLLNQQLEALATDPPKPIPAIVLTANDQERDRAFSQGFYIHLMEPVEISELVAAIANLTGRLLE